MSHQVFADGIARIRVHNGTVRLEFVAGVAGTGAAVEFEPQVRVVMSVQGFVAAYNTMQRAMAELITSGVIASPGKGTATDSAGARAAPATRKRTV